MDITDANGGHHHWQPVGPFKCDRPADEFIRRLCHHAFPEIFYLQLSLPRERYRPHNRLHLIQIGNQVAFSLLRSISVIIIALERNVKR